VFHFMQGYWYRLLVDVNLEEFERKLKGDKGKDKMLAVLKEDYNIILN
jgi:hypothetical protein